ncbi:MULTISPECIES: amidohydrolase family protein [Ramlibacter]|uniref:Amidohydrolase family protein n=1 Tax=Ramlibacter pinisoli TaxID=2682844 RepID=A0A6N8IW52_9BURK|nr:MULTISPECIES: amidohydrolase family protein [Ramlibacter]MBA2961074.1 amidohydrolase family protein [Ramlibacter sp. CGMCC 1.13660]MVQ31018.1 amidohydrolase family protein [Ramlibacter pinisoli]
MSNSDKSAATILPPHPNPSRPAFRLPPGACDAHCHVFGPGDRFPYSGKRTYTPPDAPAAGLRALHQLLGIERVVLVQASVHGHDNSAMLDAIAQSPDTYRGVAMVGAGVTDAELQELHRGGVRSVRFNFVQHLGGAPDLPTVQRMAERIKPLGWHLVLHLDAEDLVTYREFLLGLPVPFAIDHMGRTMVKNGLDQRPFQLLLDLVKSNEKAWVKVSGAERISDALSAARGGPYADAAPFARQLIEAAPDRVLWGTDWPHPNVREMPDDGKLVDLLQQFTPDETLLRKLLVDNPTRLYWYD